MLENNIKSTVLGCSFYGSTQNNTLFENSGNFYVAHNSTKVLLLLYLLHYRMRLKDELITTLMEQCPQLRFSHNVKDSADIKVDYTL